MPELPEVESVRRGLQDWAAGHRVIRARVLDPRILGTTSQRVVPPGAADHFVSRITGARLDSVERRGKFMWLPMTVDGAQEPVTGAALSVHLGMSGQFRVHDPSDPVHPHTRAVFDLVPDPSGAPSGGPAAEAPVTPDAPPVAVGGAPSRGVRELRFVDQRIFGHLGIDRLVDSHGYAVPSGAAHIALDPLDPRFDLEGVARAIGRKRSGMKAALLDQGLLSGIGNIYADEALFAARVHPLAPTATTRISRVRAVLEAAHDVMSLALAQGGTSFDALYVDVNGESGYFARSLQAYGRAGSECFRCEGIMQKLVAAGRTSHYCPVCQKAPRRR
ncbi:bifunctional DNA-formamidopyrimidine glycosylase/DNA-(apurinic or apyrimidinic site) lyase [Brevibacterium litoralis]|uniref:bifunctional DNA-formamidopyrimidine glycosylase/DNA-(apurinic or apyrimidinic site) lyase n=1 Tax=Brevibacterium litoralis TaxID=3138935 RepID=UPI0032EDEAC1